VLFDDVLVPARHLLDSRAIAQVEMAEIEYFHLLLDQHDIILAEGAPCESLLEISGDSYFDNESSAPDSLCFLAPCAPRIMQGEKLQAIREQLRAHALVM
jgi:hypothetical protein